MVPLGFRYGSRHESDLLAKNAFADIPFSSSHGAKDFLELDAHLHLGNSQRDIADYHKAICILHAQDSWMMTWTCLDDKSCWGRRGISGCGGEGQIQWRNDSNWEASQKISSRKKSVWVCLCRFLGQILQDHHRLPQNSSKFYICCCHLWRKTMMLQWRPHAYGHWSQANWLFLSLMPFRIDLKLPLMPRTWGYGEAEVDWSWSVLQGWDV